MAQRISGFQFGFLPTVYEISFMMDPSFPTIPSIHTCLASKDAITASRENNWWYYRRTNNKCGTGMSPWVACRGQERGSSCWFSGREIGCLSSFLLLLWQVQVELDRLVFFAEAAKCWALIHYAYHLISCLSIAGKEPTMGPHVHYCYSKWWWVCICGKSYIFSITYRHAHTGTQSIS